MVGYTGGANQRPTYESVCGGDGHTEAIRIEFDPSKVSYETLLDEFKAGHRPMRGNPQYKSAIWYENEEQKRIAEESIKDSRSIDLDKAPSWHDAEDYHQKYYTKKDCCVQ
mmetsp:Transcript_4076/g.6436  ORF Transcript_4076/g.6436 Transcript_4076/m.6436 type:complete len:111 (-) Transcript_4076:153-485(-)